MYNLQIVKKPRKALTHILDVMFKLLSWRFKMQCCEQCTYKTSHVVDIKLKLIDGLQLDTGVLYKTQ